MIRDNTISRNSLVLGSIDEIRGDVLYGWIFSAFSTVTPALFVDNTPATLIGEHLPRPDVKKAIGIANDTGFAFRLPAAKESSIFSLYGVVPDGVFLVERKKLSIPVWESSFLIQLEQAAAIGRQEGAVAVVCWDGAHNPVGRAKVLYDIVSAHRPTVLFCYLHREFGGALWQPLINSDFPIVAIPWEQRRQYHSFLYCYGLSFDTIWICKPRLPSFMLAAAVSHQSTRYILDIDDDEEAFIFSQKASRASYNTPGLGLTRMLTASVTSRTVVSPTLQERFGGIIMRHARQKRTYSKTRGGGVYRIAFIGTVRNHKNVLTIARALNCVKFTTHLPLEFHVYGDIQPLEYREELAANGALLRDFLPARELPNALAAMDVVITGFPSSLGEGTAEAIIKTQVPAKISDALAAGLPVLTPDTAAISDLHTVPGVYPFTENNFREQLLAALKHTAPIFLPRDFTLDGAYAVFEKAEQQAQPVPELHALLPSNSLKEPDVRQRAASIPTLVLLWKQHDAGMYGRRVDQIARSYKRLFPDHRVFLLELLAEPFCVDTEFSMTLSVDNPLPCQVEDFSDEAGLKRELLESKCQGLEYDGVVLKTFYYREADKLRKDFFSFLVCHDLHPNNALFVLFPIIQDWRLIMDMLRPYRSVVDVVDNQLSWATDDVRRCFVLEQYFSLLASAEHVIFNAENTRAFFEERHFLDAVPDVRLVPNWYSFPGGFNFERRPLQSKTKHIFYSGNMNDRLDWNLLHAVAELPDVQLHLAGTAQCAVEKLDRLLAHDSVIYHGITLEIETLALLQHMDIALVPHIFDKMSAYMNPIKIQMYMVTGLSILCPHSIKVQGSNILYYYSVKDCIYKIINFRKDKLIKKQENPEIQEYKANPIEESYLDLLYKYNPINLNRRFL